MLANKDWWCPPDGQWRKRGGERGDTIGGWDTWGGGRGGCNPEPWYIYTKHMTMLKPQGPSVQCPYRAHRLHGWKRRFPAQRIFSEWVGSSKLRELVQHTGSALRKDVLKRRGRNTDWDSWTQDTLVVIRPSDHSIHGITTAAVASEITKPTTEAFL